MPAPHNGFTDITFIENGLAHRYSLKHLEGLSIEKADFERESGQTAPLTIHIRPTNHLYSRKFEDTDLLSSPRLLLRFNHNEGNYQSVKHPPKISSERRIFCNDKYEASKLFPAYIDYLKVKNPHCVLANRGDTRTCLSALIEVGESNSDYYLVIFKLHKADSKNLNMLIETAFIIDKDDDRAKRITEAHSSEKKPFLLLARNILAGRGPFEKRKQSKSVKKKRKDKKKAN